MVILTFQNIFGAVYNPVHKYIFASVIRFKIT